LKARLTSSDRGVAKTSCIIVRLIFADLCLVPKLILNRSYCLEILDFGAASTVSGSVIRFRFLKRLD
jgi:hypothetical protein